MATKNPTPLLYQLREGSVSDPFVDKVENVKLVAGRAILDEIPVKQFGIIVDGHQETGTNNPTGVQFYADYTNGVLYFEPTKTGNVTVRYKGRGVVQIPSDRIFHPDAETNETLDLTFKRLEAKVKDAETKGNVAESQGNTASTQATHAKTQGDYAKSQGDYAKAQGDLAKGVVAGVIPNATQNASGLMSAGDKTALDNGQKWKLTNNDGTVITPPNGTNFDSLLSSGMYRFVIDLGHYGSPGGYYYNVIVQGFNPGVATQLWIATNNENVFIRRYENGSWKPFRRVTEENTLTNTLMGNKITVQSNANFIGKIAGSTTANPHIFKRANSSNVLLAPTGFGIEPAQTEYDNINNLNASSSLINAITSGNYAQMLFSFNLIEHVQHTYGTIPGASTADKVAWLKANANKVTFNWWGFGSGVYNSAPRAWAYLSCWLNTSWWRAWEQPSANVSLAKPSISGANLVNSIDSSGFIHFLIHADPSDGTTASVINTDYVELQVELSTDIKTNLLLGGVQGYKLTADDGKMITLPNDTDFNSVNKTGIYSIRGNINAPENTGGVGRTYMLQHVEYDSIWAVQTATDFTNMSVDPQSSAVYVRSKKMGIGWSKWRKMIDRESLISHVMGNSITDQSNANFIGKVSGSTTANPHISRFDANSQLNSPMDYLEITQNDYNKILALDGISYSVTTSIANIRPQHKFSFNLIEHVQRTYGTIPGVTTADKVAWLKSNTSKLTFNWWGFGSSPLGNKAMITMWRATGLWESSTYSHTNSSSTKLTYNMGGSNLETRIDSNGFAHFLAYAEPSDGTTPSIINTDYVELIVDLDTSLKKNLAPTWIDAVLQNGWVELDSSQKPQYSLGVDGYVTLKGAIKSGTMGQPNLTLPSGFRPTKTFYGLNTGAEGNIYRVTVSSAGSLTINQSIGSSGSAFVSLDGIRFPTN